MNNANKFMFFNIKNKKTISQELFFLPVHRTGRQIKLQFPIYISGITKINPIKKVNVKNIKDVQFSEWSEPIRDAILETLHAEISTKLTKNDYDVTPIFPKEFYIKGNKIYTLFFDLTIPRKIEITCLGKNNAKGRFNTYVIPPIGTVK